MTSSPKKRVIVVGGGLAGLACTIKLAEEGVNVDLFSMVPVKRSHSVCAQGGINACNDIARQQGYSEWMHFDETVLGGDFLADQPPVLEMAQWAPRIVDLLTRMGVPFNRTAEGQRELRLFGGSLFRRAFFAGATTGQQLLYALDEQTRRHESEGLVKKYEFWEFLWPVIHEGQCLGIVAQDMRTMQIRSFRADAVVMASGGNGLIFGKSTMSGHLHGRGGVTLLSGGRGEIRQSGDDPGSSDRHPRRRQMPPDIRIGPRRRGSVWSPHYSPTTTANPITSPRPSAITSSKSGIPSTATSFPATLPPARSSKFARMARAWAAATWSISTSGTRCRNADGRRSSTGSKGFWRFTRSSSAPIRWTNP